MDDQSFGESRREIVVDDLLNPPSVFTYEQDQLYAHIPDLADSLSGIRSRIERYESAIEALEARWNGPDTTDHELMLLRRFEAVFEKICRDIEEAEHHVQLSLTPEDFRTLKSSLSRAYKRGMLILVLIQTLPEGDLSLSEEDFEGVGRV